MRFANPTILFALSAVSIPILIHLFNLRKFKRVLFTNVQLLKEVQQQTIKQHRLKHLLVLLSRILFILFLVFAFPFGCTLSDPEMMELLQEIKVLGGPRNGEVVYENTDW